MMESLKVYPFPDFSGKFKKWERLVDEEHKKLMNAYNSGKNYSIRAYGGYESINGNKPEIFHAVHQHFLKEVHG